MLLRLVHPKMSSRTSQTVVTVDFALESHTLVASFDVRHQPEPYVNEALGKDSSQWGLWEHDVVELFLRVGGEPTYYEFQVSPLGQFFELEIFEPRKRVNDKFKSGFTYNVERHAPTDWSARLRLPLKNLGWDERLESLRGNAFAILGNEPRTYWSTGLPEQDTPDFHLPQYFIPLFR